jgi:haloacetate dehalogenase
MGGLHYRSVSHGAAQSGAGRVSSYLDSNLGDFERAPLTLYLGQKKGADHYLQWVLDHWCGTKGALAAEAVAEYLRCFDAAAIHGTCEEFRAAATIDLIHDEADKEHKISCPTLLLWSATSMWATYDILEVWRSRAEDVQGMALDCGHFLPEEEPERTAAELIRFLS